MDSKLENKAKFFAQYFGQNILSLEFNNSIYNEVLPCIPYNWNGQEKNCSLELKPISSITDEDLKEIIGTPIGWEVYKVYKFNEDGFNALKIRKKYDVGEIDFNEDGYKYDIKHLRPNEVLTYQLLQEKGYALPYLDLSVSDLEKLGWIKLVTNE